MGETAAKLPETTTYNHDNAHEVVKGDSRIDGPYLDDIRAAQEDEYRRQRTEGAKSLASIKAAENAGTEEEAAKSEEEKTPEERLAWHKLNVTNPNIVPEISPADPAEMSAQDHFGADTYREKDEQDPLIPNDSTPTTVNKQRNKKYLSMMANDDNLDPVDGNEMLPRTLKPRDTPEVALDPKKKGKAKKEPKLPAGKKITSDEAPTKKTVSKKRAEAKKRQGPVRSTVTGEATKKAVTTEKTSAKKATVAKSVK